RLEPQLRPGRRPQRAAQPAAGVPGADLCLPAAADLRQLLRIRVGRVAGLAAAGARPGRAARHVRGLRGGLDHAGLRGGGALPARLAPARCAGAQPPGADRTARADRDVRDDPGDRTGVAGMDRRGLAGGGAGAVVVLRIRLRPDGPHRRGGHARSAPGCARIAGRAGMSDWLQTGVYVTGTDTGVGKTAASCTLLHALRARGLRAVGMKPLASGCERTPDGLRNEDALALLAASDPQPAYADLNPYALPEPLAPEIAARGAGIEVALGPMLEAHARLQALADVVVVDGVGGWMAPLAGELMQADLVRALRVPVVLVVGLRLGWLNHAYLSARALAADGCELVGWIGTNIDPAMARIDENRALLADRLPAPCLGWLPWQA